MIFDNLRTLHLNSFRSESRCEPLCQGWPTFLSSRQISWTNPHQDTRGGGGHNEIPKTWTAKNSKMASGTLYLSLHYAMPHLMLQSQNLSGNDFWLYVCKCFNCKWLCNIDPWMSMQFCKKNYWYSVGTFWYFVTFRNAKCNPNLFMENQICSHFKLRCFMWTPTILSLDKWDQFDQVQNHSNKHKHPRQIWLVLPSVSFY